MTSNAVTANRIRFRAACFICAILNVQKPYCNQMPRPETITSAANPLVKDVRRAISRGGLTEQGWCVAETFHLLEEALRSDCEVMTVLASQSGRMEAEARVGLAGIPVVVLADALFKKIAGTETSQGVIALVKPPAGRREQMFGERPMVVVLDQLQDPGNVGTIIRSEEHTSEL